MANTQQQYLNIYNSTVNSLNGNILTGVPGTDIFYKSMAVSQIASNVSSDIENLANNIFPSSSTGPYLDYHAANMGLTPRRGALPAIGTCTLSNAAASTTSFVISAGTTLTSAITNQQYYVMTPVSVALGTMLNTVSLSVASTNFGSGTSSLGNLTFTTTIVLPDINVTTAVISNMVDGTNQESDSELSARIFNYEQFPRGAGSIGDYIKWCYLGDPNVTQALVIKNNYVESTSNIFLLFPTILGGSPDPDYYIDGNSSNNYEPTPYPISRALNNSVISNVQTYMNDVKGVNDNPNVLTVSTYGLKGADSDSGVTNGIIEVYVSLSTGITFSTVLSFPAEAGGDISVGNLICKEIRRSIISAPTLGTLIYLTSDTSDYYIPLSGIEIDVLNALNNNANLQGNYASIITGLFMRFNIEDSYSYYIPVPSIQDGNLIQATGTGQYTAWCVYDISDLSWYDGVNYNPAIRLYDQANPS